MRLPVIGSISTKDGSTNKNARLTNMLAEQKKNGTTLATVRPCIDAKGTTTGIGNGLVCFGGELVSVYESNMGVWNVLSSGSFDLGPLGSGNGIGTAYGCSADCSVIVGEAYDGSGRLRAFRWTSSGGMADLGTLGGNSSTAYATNSDGSVVVGRAQNGSGQYRAFRWTSGGGMVDLGTLGGTGTHTAFAVSSDGSVVVGTGATVSYSRAFRWTSGGGMVDLGTLGGNNSQGRGCSADGSVVVGIASNVSSVNRAFRWTSGGGMVDLGVLSGNTESQAYGISGDGNIVVGASFASKATAFRWDSTDGMIALDSLNPAYDGYAYCSNYDGSIIFGSTRSTSALRRMTRWPYPLSAEDWGDSSDATKSSYGYACDYYGNIAVGQDGSMHPFRNSIDEVSVESGITTVTDGTYDFALIP